MKKFKTFHCGIDSKATFPVRRTAVEWVNDWLAENPEAKILEFRHSLDKDDHDVICILYEEPEKEEETPYIVYMEFAYDSLNNLSIFRCPHCGDSVYINGRVTTDRVCYKCSKGLDKKS